MIIVYQVKYHIATKIDPYNGSFLCGHKENHLKSRHKKMHVFGDEAYDLNTCMYEITKE